MAALTLPVSILNQKLSELTPEQLQALGLRRPATDDEISAYDQAHQQPGAPADFGGMVLPNPNGIKVSDDTDPGIPETKLDGATFQKQNYSGPTRVSLASTGDKISLPPGAELETAGDSAPAMKLPPGAELETDSDKAKPSQFSHVAENFLSGLGVTDDAGAKKFFEHPISTALDALGGQGELAKKAKAAYDRGDYKGAIMHGLNYLVPFIGQQTDQAGEQLNKGDISGGIARTIGAAVPIVAGSPEVQAAAGDVASAAVKATKPLLSKTGAAATAIGQSLDPDVVGLLSPRTAHALRLANKVGKVATKLGKSAAPAVETEAAPVVTPSEAEPFEGIPSPQAEHASTMAEEEAPAAAEPTPADVINKPVQSADLDKVLNDALGGKPLQRNAPIAKRPGVTAVDTSKPAALPEGFTPVDSSLLKGYKYDPAAQEFTAILKNGQSYTHGQVSPEQVEAFENADSQGSAWTKHIKQGPGTVLVKKNGQAVATGTMQSATGEIIPKSEAGMTTEIPPELAAKAQNLSDFIKQSPKKAMATPAAKAATPKAAVANEDLTSLLQQSLDQVGKGGVFTSAPPKMLLDRWGVDPESFAEGRAQTRGMKPEESADAINKLAATYKKHGAGAVEPVLETRDRANNLISVDGRSRALAAHKAGIERIPIIVRRLQ